MINDLLDVSRIISGKMRISPQKDVHLQDLITRVLGDLRPTAETKSIQVSLLPGKEIYAPMDPDRMRQIIWNLVSNSIKFTPKAGKITVATSLSITSYQIEVKDTGIGLEKDQLLRIFDRFSQVQDGLSRSGGLGLGLSIVKSLVELHGGRISAHSAGADRGTTFKVIFPLYEIKLDSTNETVKTASANSAQLHLENVKILVAEDQSEAAAALSYTLKKWGANIALVHDGMAALKLLEQERYDLILSDIGMPDMDGLDLMKSFRRLEAQRGSTVTPAIALTAYATAKDRIRCLEAGYQSHLPKPVDRTELIAVIRSLGLGT